MTLRYLLHMLMVLPCLPFLLYQANRIKKRIPKLPDAIEPEGLINSGGTGQIRLIILGESTVAGVGVHSHKDGLSGCIAKNLAERLHVNVSWKAYGRSGYATNKIYLETVPEMEKENVNLIAIALGGNDAFEMNTPWGWRQDIRHLIKALKNKFPEAQIAFMHLPPIKEFPAFPKGIQWALGTLVEIFGDALADEIQHHENAFFHHQIVSVSKWNIQAGMDLPPEAFFSDGVHPSKLNYQLWAADFSGWLIDQDIIKS